jgi:hypothetical protein
MNELLKRAVASLLGILLWAVLLMLLCGLASLLLYLLVAADEKAREHAPPPKPTQGVTK